MVSAVELLLRFYFVGTGAKKSHFFSRPPGIEMLIRERRFGASLSKFSIIYVQIAHFHRKDRVRDSEIPQPELQPMSRTHNFSDP